MRNPRTTRILLKLDDIEKKLLPKLEEHPVPSANGAEPEPSPEDKLQSSVLQEKVILRAKAKITETMNFVDALFVIVYFLFLVQLHDIENAVRHRENQIASLQIQMEKMRKGWMSQIQIKRKLYLEFWTGKESWEKKMLQSDHETDRLRKENDRLQNMVKSLEDQMTLLSSGITSKMKRYFQHYKPLFPPLFFFLSLSFL